MRVHFLTCCLLSSIVTWSEASQVVRFMHATDMHFDPLYQAGMEVEEQCHRTAGGTSRLAGLFGDRQCDTPDSLIDVFFERVRLHLKPVTVPLQDKSSHLEQENIPEERGGLSFIIYTGDSTRHDIDSKHKRTSRDILDANSYVVARFQSILDTVEPDPSTPDDGTNHTSLRIIPSIGNNDLFKHDQLEAGPNENLKKLARVWQPWLPTKLARKTFKKGGYFYVDQPLVDQKSPSLMNRAKSTVRVISLNTIYFYQQNQAVTGCEDPKSPGAQQFVWLRSVLDQVARRSSVNETDPHAPKRAYLIGHIPPLTSTYTLACYTEYVKVVHSYRDIIDLQVFGHTNTDSLCILSSNAKEGDSAFNQPIPNCLEVPSGNIADGAVLIAPSITPVFNPAYRIYEVDVTSGSSTALAFNAQSWSAVPRAFTQYYADLAEGNAAGHLEFKREYRSDSAPYNLPDLTLATLLEFTERMKRDDSLLREYLRRQRVGILFDW